MGVTERTPDRGGPCDRFFEPFDPERKGKVSRKVFRNLMENVGEPFSRAEVRARGEGLSYFVVAEMPRTRLNVTTHRQLIETH